MAFSESFLQIKGTEYPSRDLAVVELCLLGRASPPDAFSVRISPGAGGARPEVEGSCSSEGGEWLALGTSCLASSLPSVPHLLFPLVFNCHEPSGPRIWFSSFACVQIV